jgi:hypothetical protein
VKQMDTVGWYIATLHQMLGHDKTAAALGEAPYNKNTCILCLYEKGEATKDDVIERIGVGE